MGHVGEGELSGEVCPEAVLRAGPGGRVRHHHRLQHPGAAQLAPENLRLQVCKPTSASRQDHFHKGSELKAITGNLS